MARQWRKLLLIALAGALICGCAAAQASVTVYTNRSAWEAAVISYYEETFSDAALNPGVSVASTLPGYVDTAKGVWWDSLYGPSGTGGPTTTTWRFGQSAVAFGGNWDCGGPGGPGAGIAVLAGDGWSVVGEISPEIAGGFWGFVSTDSFTQVRLAAGSGEGWAESYELDNLVYGFVPEPSSALSLLALMPIAMMRNRKR